MRQHTIRVAGAEFFHPADMEEAIKVGREIGHHLERGDPDKCERDACGCVVWTWKPAEMTEIQAKALHILDALRHPMTTTHLGERLWGRRRHPRSSIALPAANVIKGLRKRGWVDSDWSLDGDRMRHQITQAGREALNGSTFKAECAKCKQRKARVAGRGAR